MEANSGGSKGMNITLWIVQGLLALSFFFGGWGKMTFPLDQLLAQVPWASAVPEWLMRFIGASEVAGAIGVLVPSITRIKPGLTILAAQGLTLIMVLALVFHVYRSEFEVTPYNLVLGGMAYFVAWGRMKKSPISPR